MQYQSGKNIFFLGATRFDSSAQSTSFTIAQQLAEKNFVFYIDYPITWKDYFKKNHKQEIENRKSKFSPGSDGILTTGNPNFKIIIIPPLLSINFLPEGFFYRTLLKFNERIISNRIKKVIKRYKISDYVYINSFNFHYPGIAEKLTPSLKIYHCVDPMIMPYDVKHGIISENMLVEKSDFVVCTSRQLYSEKLLLNPNTHFIPNAADISHSGKALDENLLVHQSIANLKKPIIGYIGTIERRIDYELLKEVIETNHDKTFVLAGPVAHEYVPNWLTDQTNVCMPGSIPYKDLPNLLKGFDLAIIPFKKDDVSSTIFPLKLFEYLGAGKPVVLTNFNKDLKEFTSGIVTYCEDSASFSEAISSELNSDSELKRQGRIEVAAENTWEKRASEFDKLIETYLSKIGT